MAEDNKPTLHHLNNSQSQRILWLLEELGIKYNLIKHERQPPNHPTGPFLAPESLKATGPYGKAPVLITGKKDGERYISESSAIATYLIRTFDVDDKFGMRGGDWVRDDVLCSVISTNLGRATGVALYMDLGMIKRGEGPLGGRVTGPGAFAVLGDLERELKEGGGEWFGGKELGRADMLAEYPVSLVKQRQWVDLKSEYPGLDAWLERVYAREAFKRGLEKGNGYDLSTFPKVPERR